MGHTAALFVRVVSAVIVVITLPAARDAAVVFAAELVGLTGALVWGRQDEEADVGVVRGEAGSGC